MLLRVRASRASWGSYARSSTGSSATAPPASSGALSFPCGTPTWRSWSPIRRGRRFGLLDSKTEKAEKGGRVDKHLLLTRYDPIRAERGEMLKVDDVLEILSIPLLGIIPESQEVLRASNLGQPVTISNAASAPARAYADAVRRLRGEAVDLTIPSEKKSFLGGLFTRRAA